MRLRTEILITLGALVLLQLFTAFVSVQLHGRMGPAIGRILTENVASKEAVEEMLAAMAAPGKDGPARFDTALAAAEANITEEAERPLLRQIRESRAAAFSGHAASREELVTALLQLGEVNLRSMSQADAEARRLGTVGSWTVVLLGTAAFAVSVASSRRMTRRLVEPLAEVEAALEAWRAGDAYRRCALREAPLELERVATETNRLLDEACASAQRADQRIHQLDRAALLALMDQSPQPILLVHPELGVLAANRAGLRLSEDERAAALSMTPPWAPTPLAGQAGVLMTRGSAG